MARIILHNGKIQEVDYYAVIAVNDILQGRTEPETPEQALYMKQVKSVEFDSISESKPANAHSIPPKEHDPVMRKIISDPSLKGKAKMKAVIERIKERRTTK